jgi:ribonuclease P protein subunit POP4
LRISPSIVKHELIGLNAEIARSRNPSYLGIGGTIVDETRNTFRISHSGRTKTIIKDQAAFSIAFPGSAVVQVDGATLRGRPSDRLKRRVWRRW